MITRCFAFLLALLALSTAVLAELDADQEYINKLDYQRNRLILIAKKRVVDEKRNYSSTNINTTTYTNEAYSQTYGNIYTSSLSQAELKEIPDWSIFKGSVRELSDLEFLQLVGEQGEYRYVYNLELQKNIMRGFGFISIGTGVVVMVGGAALSAGQAVVTGGALLTAAGFFISAFNQPPHHYILPDYAQEKIDNYNIHLKQKLALPLNYE